MTSPEFIQSAATAIHQARELFDAGVKTNLLQTLIEQGHPYGIVLNMGVQSWPSILLYPSTSSLILGVSSANVVAEFGPLSSAPFSGSFLVNFSIVNTILFDNLLKRRQNGLNSPESGESWLAEGYHDLNLVERINTRLEFSSKDSWAQGSFYGLLLTSLSKSFLKSAINTNQDFNNFWNSQVVLAPGILKSLTELGERPRELRVGRNSIGLGSSSIHLGTFRGETPYVIKSPQGDTLTQVNPGDTLGSIHVTSQANLLRNLSPLEKVNQITEDFMDLLKALDFGTPGLNDLQQKTINRAKSATIIGISHLVRLFGRKTGLPTWKLDVLPELVQRFHQHDSQAVSKAFGGTRKVKSSDVEMMVITPAIRQQLVGATL